MRHFWVVSLFCGSMASCEKAAPEPPIQRVASATGKSGAADPSPGAAGSSAKRAMCVRTTPASPPPAPPHHVDPKCPADPAGGSPMVPIGHVSFPESKDAPLRDVELMLTSQHQERGLMYRKSLADDKGILFVWPQPSVHTFWMHNTCIPLDMLFIDREGFVAGIVENAPTLNDEGRSVDCP